MKIRKRFIVLAVIFSLLIVGFLSQGMIELAIINLVLLSWCFVCILLFDVAN